MRAFLVTTITCTALMFGAPAWAAEEVAPKDDKKIEATAAKPVTGTIVSVGDGKLVVSIGRGKKAADHSFTADDKTSVQINSKPATLADLKVQMRVSITTNGDRATAITDAAHKKSKDHKTSKKSE